MTIFENKLWQRAWFPLSLGYALIIRLRNLFYDKKIFKSYQIERARVISVGNIAVGGTGKTPTIEFLAHRLQAMGHRVAVLSRGYGRQSRGRLIVSDGNQLLVPANLAGDEPTLLAHHLPGVPIVVDKDRYQAAKFIEQNFGSEIILLDDGFQHRRLQRDLDIVLIDATRGFGAGLLLPAGFLREPISSLKRSHLIWLTRIDQALGYQQLIETIRRHTMVPILTSYHEPRLLIHAWSGQPTELTALRHQRVLLFSGIAHPVAFERTVRDCGAQIVDHVKFPDHHAYSRENLQHIMARSGQLTAALIVTTEKDYVRLKHHLTAEFSSMFYIRIEIGGVHDETVLNQALTLITNKKSLKM
ncbi:MAG: tetraacyldisaccharide 4'-kinase [candidate division KSB1 bacterium]|nr:tetraacyldisaccharide 4'-kinase [candidate division KSB1 bacterium]MDZ7317699.1 tetraacyldisaccharide 4'-kinase [candidate division KSB1 bacterium]MDZ7342341.1 tetraacyldisaccharide 4'-kinase [candidate division KSB1 bacterium]